MLFIYKTNSIPIIYYGQEQGTHVNFGIYNREALWTSGHQNTTAVHLIAKLNRLRQWMIKRDSDYLTRRMSILSTTASSIAIQKGSIISIITNIGSPVGDRRSFRDIAEFDIILASCPFIFPTSTMFQPLSEYPDKPLLDLTADLRPP